MAVHRFATALLVVMLFGGAAADSRSGSGPVAAQAAATPAAPGSPSHGGSHRETESGYANRFDATAAIRSLTPEQVGQIERGEGAGFALPAELNGVPGPRHVLDLAAELDLTPAQVAEVEAVFAAMRAESITAGGRYLDAVLALEEGFRDGTLTADDLPARVAEVKRLEGELATTHLAAHFETAALLTPEQIAAYGRLRGYE